MLSEAQRKLFKEWCSAEVGFGYHFKALEHRTGLPRTEIRQLVHGLAAEGLLEFQRGCFTDEGEVYGSAYVLTPAGRASLEKGDGSEGGKE